MTVGYWENLYRSGHRQYYPWDCVVSFVYRAIPAGVPRSEIKILEVGFGTASNLWFAAREGFSVSGIEASKTAVSAAVDRFAEDGLRGDLRHGDFTKLPFDPATFDLIIDRAALSCATYEEIGTAIEEIARVAKPNARLFFNPYAENHRSATSGRPAGDRTRTQLDAGSLAGLAQITFLEAKDVDELFAGKWALESKAKLEIQETLAVGEGIHSEWRVVARRL